MSKPPLSFSRIWQLSFGFMGIQFGWGLQMANMSPIYEMLGARESELAMLWIAAPLTGLLVQPVVGHLSDRTWNSLGRRKPYFLVGALLSTLALIAMPNSSALWMAVGLLWVLDASINVTMEPFRAFVADMLPEEQRPQGFSVQTVLIGIGAVVSSSLPWILAHGFGVSSVASGGERIPPSVRLAFYLGGAVLLVCVLVTILTTREYPPPDLAAFERMRRETAGVGANLRAILDSIRSMPDRMKQLAWVQLFTWGGLFCLWTYFGPAVARHIYGATEPGSALYAEGAAWGGVCFSVYNGVALIMAFVLVGLVKTVSPKILHACGLLCGALGLLSVLVITHRYALLGSMVGVGIAWACILAMPYAMLAGCLPEEKMGTYMGVFNFFIVIPQVAVALGSGWLVTHVFHEQSVYAVALGGVLMGIAAWLVRRVEYPHPPAR